MPRIDSLVGKIKLTGLKKLQGDLKALETTIAGLNASLTRATSGADLTNSTRGIRATGNAADTASKQVKKLNQEITSLTKIDPGVQKALEKQFGTQQQLNQMTQAREQHLAQLRKLEKDTTKSLENEGAQRLRIAQDQIAAEVGLQREKANAHRTAIASIEKSNERFIESQRKAAEAFKETVPKASDFKDIKAIGNTLEGLNKQQNKFLASQIHASEQLKQNILKDQKDINAQVDNIIKKGLANRKAQFEAADRAFLESRKRFLKQFEAVRAGRPGTRDRATLLRNDAEARQQVKGILDSANGVEKIGQAAKRAVGPLRQVASFFGRIALFTVAASVITRGFFAIGQAITSIVGTAIEFNSVLEQGRLAIAGILVSTREVRDSTGQLLKPAEAYSFLLSRASALQREVLIRSISTLGTAEELADVFQRILGLSADQVATDEQRLDLAQNILNAGKLLGLNGEQLAVEARQLLTLETNRGQLILQSLGISRKQLIAFRDQGILVEKLNEELAAFSALAEDAAGSFVGLTSSIETAFKLLAGATFEDIFRGLKDVFVGVRNELLRLEKEGGLTVLLGLTKQQLVELGETLTRIAVAGFQKLAQAIAETMRFFAQNKIAIELAILPLKILGETIGLVVRGFKILVALTDAITSFFGKLANLLGLSAKETKAFADEMANLFNIIKKGLGGAVGGAILGGIIGLFFGPGGAAIGAVKGAKIGAALGAAAGAVDNIAKTAEEAEPKIEKFNIAIGILKQRIDEFSKQKISSDNPISKIKEQSDAIRDTIANLSVSIGQELSFEQQMPLVKELGLLNAALGEAQGEFIELGNREKEAGEEINRLKENFKSFRDEVEELERSLGQQFALDIGDVDTFERLGLERIEAERQDALEKFKGLKGEEVEIERKAALQRLELRAEVAEKVIELEKKIADETRESIQRQVDAQQAVIEAAETARQASIAHLQAQLQIAEEQGASLRDQVELQKQINDLQIEGAQAQLNAINKNIDSTKEHIKLIEAQIEASEKQIEVLKEQIKAQGGLEKILTARDIKTTTEDIKEQRKEIARLNNELTTLGGSQQAAQTNIRTTQVQAAQAMQSLTTQTLQLGDIIKDSIGQVFDALIAGTLDLEDAFKSFGLAIGKRFTDALAGMITDKLGFDLVFQKNLGSLNAGFGSFATGLSTSFGSLFQSIGIDFDSLTHNLGVALEAALQFDFQAIFGSGGALASGFQNLGVLGGGALGFGISRGLGSALGLGGTSGLGGTIGGALGAIVGSFFGAPQIGAFIGSFFGDISEAIFGDLFKHTPTKGTLIRKGTIDFLRDLEVIFSDELDKDDYFFGGTKKLASQLNISFLEASRLAISEFRPSLHASGLTDDLRALGIFLTRDAADAVGKDLEQSAITFGNLIANNLQDDVEAVQAFIDDTVDKTGITLGGLLHVIAEDFADARISIELFEQAVRGAFNIFDELAPSIDIAAFREAATFLPEHGGFNADRFEDLIEGAIGATEVLGRATVDAITEGINEGLTEAIDYEALFRRNVLNNFRDVIAQGFIDGMIQGMLISPALAFAFTEFERIIADFVAGTISAEMFTQQMNAALESARPELELWAEAVGMGGEILVEWLNTALPVVQDINDSVTGTANEVARTARELQNIADSLRQAANDMLTGPLSPLPKKRRLEIALAEFVDLRDRALGGDVEAARQLISQGNEVISLAREIFKSSGEFKDIFDFVFGTLTDVADAFDQGIDLTGVTDGTGTGATDGTGTGTGPSVARQPNVILEDMLIELRAIRSVLEFSTGIFVGGTPGPGSVPGGTGTGAQTPFTEALNVATRDLGRFQSVIDQSNDILTSQFQGADIGLQHFAGPAERANIRAAINRSVDETTTNINDLIEEILKADPNANVSGLQQGLMDLESVTRILTGDAADISNVSLKHIIDNIDSIIAGLNAELIRLGQAPIPTTQPPAGALTPEPIPTSTLTGIFGNMDLRLFNIQNELGDIKGDTGDLVGKTVSPADLDKLLNIHTAQLDSELFEIRQLLTELVLIAENAAGGSTETLAKQSADTAARAVRTASRNGQDSAAALGLLASQMGLLAQSVQSRRGLSGNINAVADIAKAFPFQHGGIVMDPMLGLVGEAGPEAVIPLSNATNLFDNTELIGELQELRAEVTLLRENAGAGGTQSIQVEGDVNIEGERMGQFVMRRVNDGLRRNDIKVPERALTRR